MPEDDTSPLDHNAATSAWRAEDVENEASADTSVPQDVDPIEFLRRALQISPEDAAGVREDAAKRDVSREERTDGDDDAGSLE